MIAAELASAAEIRRYHSDQLTVLEILHARVSRGFAVLCATNEPSAEDLARAIEIIYGMSRVHETALRDLGGK